MTSASPAEIETLFRRLLGAARELYEASPELCDFVAWPTDLVYVAPQPRPIPALPQIRAMARDGGVQVQDRNSKLSSPIMSIVTARLAWPAQ